MHEIDSDDGTEESDPESNQSDELPVDEDEEPLSSEENLEVAGSSLKHHVDVTSSDSED
jgi:hypothetical protein